ncbi:putative Polyadenylation factor subunit 2 [Blattamonas nauphoetae]|uniref:Polyadenylation factor subunit 2 n=1 Tax=Blattamonas nauphoetae TaxID=2049346 RepID=A0ABQ9Y6D9_9EUKA|nr:putative Polyadenylation factor subunit 2 [Blattamonas nauphoetae]
MQPQRLSGRRVLDFHSSVIRHTESFIYNRHPWRRNALYADSSYAKDLGLPSDYCDKPMNSVCTQFAHFASTTDKTPLLAVTWSQDGHRLYTGSTKGEMVMWSGSTFTHEHTHSADPTSITCMEWNFSNTLLAAGFQNGKLKFFSSTLNLEREEKPHGQNLASLSFSPSANIIATASNDQTVKLYDFEQQAPVMAFADHKAGVKSIDWHPHLSLLLSGGADSLTFLFDLRQKKAVRCLRGHKGDVTTVDFSSDGMFFATGSEDETVLLYDMRSEMVLSRAKTVHTPRTLSFHPTQSDIFLLGTDDGALLYYCIDSTNTTFLHPDNITAGTHSPLVPIDGVSAHSQPVADAAWHPLGTTVATTGEEGLLKLWGRAQPGDGLTERELAGQVGYTEREKSKIVTQLVTEQEYNPDSIANLHTAYLASAMTLPIWTSNGRSRATLQNINENPISKLPFPMVMSNLLGGQTMSLALLSLAAPYAYIPSTLVPPFVLQKKKKQSKVKEGGLRSQRYDSAQCPHSFSSDYALFTPPFQHTFPVSNLGRQTENENEEPVASTHTSAILCAHPTFNSFLDAPSAFYAMMGSTADDIVKTGTEAGNEMVSVIGDAKREKRAEKLGKEELFGGMVGGGMTDRMKVEWQSESEMKELDVEGNMDLVEIGLAKGVYCIQQPLYNHESPIEILTSHAPASTTTQPFSTLAAIALSDNQDSSSFTANPGLPPALRSSLLTSPLPGIRLQVEHTLQMIKTVRRTAQKQLFFD